MKTFWKFTFVKNSRVFSQAKNLTELRQRSQTLVAHVITVFILKLKQLQLIYHYIRLHSTTLHTQTKRTPTCHYGHHKSAEQRDLGSLNRGSRWSRLKFFYKKSITSCFSLQDVLLKLLSKQCKYKKVSRSMRRDLKGGEDDEVELEFLSIEMQVMIVKNKQLGSQGRRRGGRPHTHIHGQISRIS